MIDVYFWPTGNGKKITIMMEECGLDYRITLIDIGKGDQFAPDFLKISPNNKMPAIVDHDAVGLMGEVGPLPLFESGAILQYLAEKTGKFMPTDTAGKYRVLQWLNWQIAGLGPNAGQAHHFLHYAKEEVPYAKERFSTEVARLYGVMDKQLGQTPYLAGDYSIADMAAWPWVYRYDWQGQDINDFPNVKRWFDEIAARPAVAKAASIGMFLMDKSLEVTALDKELIVNLP